METLETFKKSVGFRDGNTNDVFNVLKTTRSGNHIVWVAPMNPVNGAVTCYVIVINMSGYVIHKQEYIVM